MEKKVDPVPCPRCIEEKVEKIRLVALRGLCKLHYQRAMRANEIPRVYAQRGTQTTCAAEECERDVVSRGLCSSHYSRILKGSDPLAPLRERYSPNCEIDGCGLPSHARGMCDRHYKQWQDGRPFSPQPEWKQYLDLEQCRLDDCDRDAAHFGLCNTHYFRQREGGPDWDSPIRDKAPAGTGWITEQGYRMVRDGGRSRPEHRVVAERELGRALWPDEQVHHVNGDRSDNRVHGPFRMDERGRLRSGNLEIWSSAQPKGQEIGPKLEWAVDILASYGDVNLNRLRRVLAVHGTDEERRRYGRHLKSVS
ncbi:HNH endonuclease [Nonomuraea bangladeshensis]|uniref:HNH endonuclease n=1 Tax=Nonomuraea bangladeshensis TaxID=404385 RepID=UPI003C30B705